MKNWPSLRRFFSHSGATSTTSTVASPAPKPALDLPFLKTPWVYSGPEGMDISRVLATPLANNDGYALSHVVMKSYGPMLGHKIETPLDGFYTVEQALTRMSGFVATRENAPHVFTLMPGYVDFEKFAARNGFTQDPDDGFISSSRAREKAAERMATVMSLGMPG